MAMRKKRMNDKQLVVLWLGIFLISLILVFPSYQRKISSVGGEKTKGYWESDIPKPDLCIVAGLVTLGLLITYRAKKQR